MKVRSAGKQQIEMGQWRNRTEKENNRKTHTALPSVEAISLAEKSAGKTAKRRI